MMNIFKWFKRKPKTVSLDLLTVSNDIEAALVVLKAVESYLSDSKGSLPANLHEVVDATWPMIPDSIRGQDTPVNKAEFADAIHCAALFLRKVRIWMAEE